MYSLDCIDPGSFFHFILRTRQGIYFKLINSSHCFYLQVIREGPGQLYIFFDLRFFFGKGNAIIAGNSSVS